MLYLVVGAITTLIGGAVLKVVDLVIEGRGSWSRRSIAADVALLKALPDDVGASAAGVALRDKVEAALLTFSGRDDASPSSSRAGRLDGLVRRRRFEQEVRELHARLTLLAGILAAGAVVVQAVVNPESLTESDPIRPVEFFMAAIATGVGATTYLFATLLISRRIVRRRWKRRGEEVPESWGTQPRRRRRN